MNELIIDSFSEFDGKVDGLTHSALCRGVSKSAYELIPSLFRDQPASVDIDLRESNMMWLFKSHAVAHLQRIPDLELEWLTIAQHHGLPTRLLDWSLSPLVACYFSVCSNMDDDGAVYFYEIGVFKKIEEIDLKTLDHVAAFFPPHSTKRVTAQSGMFTVHPTSHIKLENDLITKLIIPKKIKRKMLDKLVKYGIHEANLFPDLDGLAKYIRYHHSYR